MRTERRAGGLAVEVRRASDNRKTVISGYAAVFYRSEDEGTEFDLWDGVVERIMPGAFDRALKESDDVRALFNHDPSIVLGRTASGTLKLAVDKQGLRYEIELPESRADIAESIERGDVTGSSFAFEPTDERWREEDGVEVREILGVRLFDVGPVTYPAYESTDAFKRSLEPVRADLDAEKFRREVLTRASEIR